MRQIGQGTFGIRQARGNPVDSNQVVRQFGSEGDGQSAHRELGHPVRGVAQKSCRRGDVQHHAAAPFTHRITARESAIDHADYVHVEQTTHLGPGKRTEGLVVLHQVAAGVVDEDVDAAKLLDRGGDGGVHLVLVGDIAAQRDRLSTSCCQFVGGAVSTLEIDISDRDGGSLAGQRPGERPPKPDGAARDESGLTLESHKPTLSRQAVTAAPATSATAAGHRRAA